MNKSRIVFFIAGSLSLLLGCGDIGVPEVELDTSQVETFVQDVSADLGIGPTATPTPSEDATPTPTRTPQPTLLPTNTPNPDGPILTGAGPTGDGVSAKPGFQLVDVTLTGEVHIVVAGDTLGEIAKEYDVTLDELYSANLDLITDVDVIEVGWELQIPE